MLLLLKEYCFRLNFNGYKNKNMQQKLIPNNFSIVIRNLNAINSQSLNLSCSNNKILLYKINIPKYNKLNEINVLKKINNFFLNICISFPFDEYYLYV